MPLPVERSTLRLLPQSLRGPIEDVCMRMEIWKLPDEQRFRYYSERTCRSFGEKEIKTSDHTAMDQSIDRKSCGGRCSAT